MCLCICILRCMCVYTHKHMYICAHACLNTCCEIDTMGRNDSCWKTIYHSAHNSNYQYPLWGKIFRKSNLRKGNKVMCIFPHQILIKWKNILHICTYMYALLCVCIWSSEDNLSCHFSSTVLFLNTRSFTGLTLVK